MEKLAIAGGEPVRKKPFPRGIMIEDEEIEAVVNTLKSRRLTLVHGGKVSEFERKFAEFHGVKSGVAVSSGTAALHVALAVAGIGPGDEVIVPAHTFLATATSVLHQNAIPIFVDIELDTYNIDPNKIEDAITDRTKTIIPVHLNGHPADMKPILEIAGDHDLIVIEDCAQAPTATYKDKKVGTFGHIACFSFFEDKLITTGGEGGMLITNDDDMAGKARLIRHHGERVVLGEARAYRPEMLGYNYRMTELQAAIGLVQLEKLERYANKRIQNSEYLTKHLKQISGLVPPIVKEGCRHVYYKYIIKFAPEKFRVSLDQFINALNAEGVPAEKRYPTPLNLQPLFGDKRGYGNTKCPFECPWYRGFLKYGAGQCPNAEIVDKILCRINMNPEFSNEDLDDIVHAIKKVSNAYSK